MIHRWCFTDQLVQVISVPRPPPGICTPFAICEPEVFVKGKAKAKAVPKSPLTGGWKQANQEVKHGKRLNLLPLKASDSGSALAYT